ncbi:MAG TPA: VOC family protein [Intrasporangium sp.]|uniref:VOC family protein n=1 Tax=Intrasporangium sp. TaxID=1925024 RepID=UPI002D77DD97|nr:VOC family protein [Intrasporangium sp.]HET7399225.1 VOC family protein [Intrasporangium sp.]
MPAITPFLWFDNQLEEALEFYARVFGDVQVTARSHYGPDMPGGMPPGSLMSASFTIAGNPFMGLNGGPRVTFNDAVSFFVGCTDQAEVDRYWDGLLDGGTPTACGWITDRFGVTWQIVPDGLFELLSGPTPEAAQRATQAMLGMQKLDLEAIRRASAGE